jgi:hypothetical protein
MTNRRFPPWTVERLPGGFKVVDAYGQSLAYFYARDNDNDAGTAGVLIMDEARRFARNFAKLPELLGRSFQNALPLIDPLAGECLQLVLRVGVASEQRPTHREQD